MSQTIEVTFSALADIKTDGGAETLIVFAGDGAQPAAAETKEAPAAQLEHAPLP